MNDLMTDAAYLSLNKAGEEVCGDRVEILEKDGVLTAVLADGLGSGVRANMLSTLTSRILCTMMSERMSVEDCVATISATLPNTETRAAYSTFTVLRIDDSGTAEIIRFDNPRVVLLRDGVRTDYPETCRRVDGRDVYLSRFALRCGDTLVALSDGALYASTGIELDYNWDLSGVTSYLEAFYYPGYSSKEICTILLDQLRSLYGGKPGDDTTVLTCRICKRVQVNLAFGPPRDPADDVRMMELFFSKRGRHVVCGGTTAKVAARYLDKPVIPVSETPDPTVPPISRIEGVDLVTEGMVTLSHVLRHANDYAGSNAGYFARAGKKDGASQIAALLLEQATDVDLFIGRADNEAYQQDSGTLGFRAKQHLAEDLADCLTRCGKRVKITWF